MGDILWALMGVAFLCMISAAFIVRGVEYLREDSARLTLPAAGEEEEIAT